MSEPITKSQINKIGKKIRKEVPRESLAHGYDKIPKEYLDSLQQYRATFKNDLKAVFSVVSEVSKQRRKDRIASFRIKRIESIISKIYREPKMALSNMGDVAGCRCILSSDGAVKAVAERLQNQLDIKDCNDYIDNPKSDGYRGIHLYARGLNDPKKLIEIQLRSHDSHDWATLVEILDILFDKKIKEGEHHKDFNRFLELMSRKDGLSIDEKKEIIDLDNRYDIYSRIHSVYLDNYVRIRIQWVSQYDKEKPYFIIEFDQNKESKIIAYPKYDVAEKKYFEKFKSTSGSNFVLVNLDKPEFSKICLAYSNYINFRHRYLEDWNGFVEDLMKHEFDKKNKKAFKYHYDYVRRNINDHKQRIASELNELQNALKSTTDHKFKQEAFDDWIQELEREMDKRSKSSKKIEEMNRELPSGWLSGFLN